jgi:P4 family phage/plasmid primase-like protien
MNSTQKRFSELLQSKITPKGSQLTHTRIGSKEQNIYGGSYLISESDNDSFMESYYNHVFVNGNKEYLTEKQLIEDGPIMIDIDLRYDSSITEKQHTPEHIIDVIMLYLDKCSEIVNITTDTPIEVYSMEKNNVNILENKTKDGIHIIIGIKMHKAAQVILRELVLNELCDLWDDLSITNSWNEVLDEGVTKGHVNWQLYGSRKPEHQAYLVKSHYTMKYNGEEWEVNDNDMKSFETKKHFKQLSARYTGYTSFSLKPDFEDKFKTALNGLSRQGQKKSFVMKNKQTVLKCGFEQINSMEILDSLLEEMFDNLDSVNYKLKEAYEYSMCLPVKYYGPGSYDKWIRVGWALRGTHYKMFLVWLKFSSREICRDTLKDGSGKFDWSHVPDMYNMWNTFESKNQDSLTNRSIMYWAGHDAKEAYNKVHSATVEFFVEQTIGTPNREVTEFDLAAVLYSLYKHRFVCVSIKKECWYEYKDNRWFEIDSGYILRLLISRDVHQLYVEKAAECTRKMNLMDTSDEQYEATRKRTVKIVDIAHSLKKTNMKNNIMREARELFYDTDFITKLDQNPYLLCFNNCIVDFKEKRARKGQPDDYISKSTNIDYITINEKRDIKIINEITQFIEELFPNTELRKYMWEHLASCLVGTNENQTFNIYTGGGSNGKSCLVDLMGKVLGDYKGTVPITLITQKRNSIGSTSSEIVQLMGTRLAVMQEPSKGDRINEGIMKEITGGDPIQGRALFKDTVTFKPQFKLVVCTNTLFDIKSNDDGTWRRIRVCDFEAKFLENPYESELKFPKKEYPYQYKKDKNIDKKFTQWAPVFVSMLVDISYKNQGNVSDSPIVMASSDQYREGQDYLAEFAKDKIIKKEGEKIKKTELLETFKQWYTAHYGRGVPVGREVYEFMDKRYGRYRQGWHNVAIVYDDDEDDVLDEC